MLPSTHQFSQALITGTLGTTRGKIGLTDNGVLFIFSFLLFCLCVFRWVVNTLKVLDFDPSLKHLFAQVWGIFLTCVTSVCLTGMFMIRLSHRGVPFSHLPQVGCGPDPSVST